MLASSNVDNRAFNSLALGNTYMVVVDNLLSSQLASCKVMGSTS